MAKFVVVVVGADDDNLLTTSTWFGQKLLAISSPLFECNIIEENRLLTR